MKTGCDFFPEEAKWIWPASAAGEVNLHVEIRHEFEVAAGCKAAVLRLAADSRYVAWINGALVGTGPFTDWPGTRSVDEWEVGALLKPGRNVLALMVCQFGVDTFSYAKGEPGVVYAVTAGGGALAASGGDTARWRISPAYRSGPMPQFTMQLPFTFEYDATRADNWREGNEGSWQAFSGGDGTAWTDCGRTFRARPVPAPNLLGRIPSSVIAQGVFRRAKGEGLAERMQHDWLSSRTAKEMFAGGEGAPVPLEAEGVSVLPRVAKDADGIYLIVDLGGESVGYLDMEMTANEGARVEIAFGEHLDDLRVRSHIGVRRFASAYLCRDGRQNFTYLITRLGARFLQLHVSGATDGFALHYAGLRELSYPVEERGAFVSPDRLSNRIHAVSVRTLRLCMHDHYDDCPWREQGLYANDMLNQSLAGYYAFGEYRFPQVSLELLGDGLAEDGLLELCAPARVPITIPSFTAAWVLAVDKNFLFSGDAAFVRGIFPRVKSVLAKWLGWMKDGLLPSPTGSRYWHFYDWTPGRLDGTVENDCTRFAHLESPRFDAPLNALFILALEAGARLARAAGEAESAGLWERNAGALRAAFHGAFWNPAQEVYATFAGETRHAPAELTQSLALLADCCPEREATAMRRRLIAKDNGLVPASLSQSLHKFEAVLRDRSLAPAVMDHVAENWGRMLYSGATTFWETIRGGWDFDLAGSLCHGWSAIPVYLYGAYTLGIRPLEPGFATFAVDPLMTPAAGTRGRVPTPAGPIEIAWDAPASSAPTLSHPPGFYHAHDCIP